MQSQNPVVLFDKATESTSAKMGRDDDKEEEQAYRDFVMSFLDRLCENCKKMREQIIIRAKCAGVLPEDGDDEQSLPEFLASLIPETQLKMVDTLRRRTVGFYHFRFVATDARFSFYINNLLIVSYLTAQSCIDLKCRDCPLYLI